MPMLLQIENLSKSYNHQVLFHKANLTVSEKKKIGVIGRNGAGKSTLFKMITQEEALDSGAVTLGKQTRLGYLEQHDPFDPTEKVLEFLVRYTGKQEWECGKVAAQFQLGSDILHSVIGGLPGGYQMRVKLTAMLLGEPNLLLLDEPTNYLDLSTQFLLERFLLSFRGSYLVISHDREFLKNVSEHTLDIENQSLFLFPRPLEDYLAYKREQLELKEKTNKNIARQKKHLQTFVDRFSAKASKASQAKSKQKQIQRLKTIEILNPLSNVRISIPKVEQRKGIALKTKQLYIGYGESKVVAGEINQEIERGKHIAVVGDNGQGKTTFMKTLAGEIEPLHGEFSWSKDSDIAYYAQHVPGSLDPKKQVFDYLCECAAPEVTTEEIYEMAGNFLFRDTQKKIGMLSGGEKARLYLAGLLLKKTKVLLLDEPSNHLDFETVEALAAALSKCNNTISFISHNRTFVNMLATGIMEVRDGEIRYYHSDYQDYVNDLKKRSADVEAGGAQHRLKLPGKPAPKPKKQANRKKTQEEIRLQRKLIRDFEKSIEQQEHERQEIFLYFRDNPSVYSQEKSKRLAQLKKSLEKQENLWLEAQGKLEDLQKRLQEK
ncbi:MAG: ABC-F family ATP-binding cassette domain-containing protein [bacterium]